MDLDCVKVLQFDTEVNSDFQKQSGASQEFTLNSCTSDVSRTYLMGKSPFPALDAFVESIASVGNVSGKIRSWYWFSEYGLMVYSMSRNRYCERIGRQHKSNHVMYIVDLRRAIYYQKCHDPDCRGVIDPLCVQSLLMSFLMLQFSSILLGIMEVRWTRTLNVNLLKMFRSILHFTVMKASQIASRKMNGGLKP
ncbi:hypothetical protein CsSME_00001809 [Camellia sinensis var. sinensis]